MSHRSWGNTTLGAANRSQIVNHHEGLVIAIRRYSGKYHIEIVTKDYGHAGTFGYTYDEDPQYPFSIPDSEKTFGYWEKQSPLVGPWLTGENHRD